MKVNIGTKLELFSEKVVTVVDINVQLDGIFIAYVIYTGKTETGEEIVFTSTAIKEKL